MKRKDKYLVGHLPTRNVVYGKWHNSDCSKYEYPMTWTEAVKMKKEIKQGIAIFKLVPVRKA